MAVVEVVETVGLLGTGAQDDHLDIHTASELWGSKTKPAFIVLCLYRAVV